MESNGKTENEVTDTVVKEENPKEISKLEEETVKEETPEDMSKVKKQIIKQLEFYFSDTNLPYDKFLRNETKVDDGWVKISVLLTFKRLASISKDPAVIASAIKDCADSILEVDETNEKIRRKLDNAIPVADQEFLNNMIDRSIYCKGFPKTATMDELLDYAATLGDKTVIKVTPRRLKTKEFKGSLYLTFNTKEQAEDFLKRDSVKYNDVELERMWERDFLDEKKKEYDEKLAAKDERKKAETEKYFKKGYLLKADKLDENMTVDGIKAVCAKFEWQVAFVKIVDTEKVAWIRLKPVKTAKDSLQDTADQSNDLNLTFSLPQDDDEQEVLNEMTKEMKGILNMKDKFKREKNKNKGGRYNNKRRNDEDDKRNKKAKTE